MDNIRLSDQNGATKAETIDVVVAEAGLWVLLCSVQESSDDCRGEAILENESVDFREFIGGEITGLVFVLSFVLTLSSG